MKTIVLVVSRSDGGESPHDDRYVVAWNPHTKAGILALTSTDNEAEARLFEPGEAIAEWRTVSRVQPVRPWDGEPNRPLTGLTVQIVPVR